MPFPNPCAWRLPQARPASPHATAAGGPGPDAVWPWWPADRPATPHRPTIHGGTDRVKSYAVNGMLSMLLSKAGGHAGGRH